MNIAQLIRDAKDARDFSGFVAAIPYSQFLGITVAELAGDLVTSLAYSDHNIGNPALPALHGGVVGALLENAAILQLLWAQDSVRVPKTITITIDYLRSAKAKDTHARAVVTKLGSRVANVRAMAWQSDEAKPIASANANFLITPAPK